MEDKVFLYDILSVSIVCIIVFLIPAMIGHNAYKHYESRAKGIAWFFVAWFFPVIGWLLYFIVRPEKK